MTENVENLVLEHLRAIGAEQGSQRQLLMDLTGRVNDIGRSVAGIRRDQGHDAAVAAHLAARVDRLNEEV